MLEILNPKNIILNQLESRFKSLNLISLMLVYNLANNSTTCKGLQTDKKEVEIEVTQKESNMINNMLISKIKKGIDFEFSDLIVKIDMLNKTIKLYCKVENDYKEVRL